jgi:hypothetical protein
MPSTKMRNRTLSGSFSMRSIPPAHRRGAKNIAVVRHLALNLVNAPTNDQSNGAASAPPLIRDISPKSWGR